MKHIRDIPKFKTIAIGSSGSKLSPSRVRIDLKSVLSAVLTVTWIWPVFETCFGEREIEWDGERWKDQENVTERREFGSTPLEHITRCTRPLVAYRKNKNGVINIITESPPFPSKKRERKNTHTPLPIRIRSCSRHIPNLYLFLCRKCRFLAFRNPCLCWDLDDRKWGMNKICEDIYEVSQFSEAEWERKTYDALWPGNQLNEKLYCSLLALEWTAAAGPNPFASVWLREVPTSHEL